MKVFQSPYPDQYDVIVAGGGPAGIAAAVSSARLGAKTALIERYGILGGMLTSGHVQPILGRSEGKTMYDESQRCFRKGTRMRLSLPHATVGKSALIWKRPSTGC